MTFLFDIGRVLLDFDFEPSLKRLVGEELEGHEEKIGRLLSRKDEFEAGRVRLEEYVDWALETIERPISREEFLAAWRDIFTKNEPMWQAVERLETDGHRLILFSNTNAIHCPWIFEAWPEFSLFDGAVLSFEVGAIKPEAAIYERAIADHELVPEETRYIDDLGPNIKAGRAFGLRCHQYRLDDHAAFERWLAAELELAR